ncbi:hypothetical protein ACJX0J_009087, partial [Zea mays]
KMIIEGYGRDKIGAHSIDLKGINNILLQLQGFGKLDKFKVKQAIHKELTFSVPAF